MAKQGKRDLVGGGATKKGDAWLRRVRGENLIYVFHFWELRGLSPHFHIHVSMSDLYFPRIGPNFQYWFFAVRTSKLR